MVWFIRCLLAHSAAHIVAIAALFKGSMLAAEATVLQHPAELRNAGL
jgi:hypothetical protein